MTTIIFPCGRCGLKHEVDGSMAGKRLACANCGGPLLLPTPRPAPPSSPRPVPPPSLASAAPPSAAALGPVVEALSYKYACPACGKRHQVPEVLFGKRVPCRRCAEPMDLPVPPGYTPRAKWALKTFIEPPRARTPEEERTMAFIPIELAGPAPGGSTSGPPSLEVPRRAVPLDDEDELLVLDDPPAPPQRRPVMPAPPPARPPAPPAPREPTLEFQVVDVYGLEDDAPPPPVWRPAEPELEASTFVPRAAYNPPKKPRRSSGGGARTAGFLGGGLGVVIAIIVRITLGVGPVWNHGDAEDTLQKINQYWRDSAALLRHVHDVDSARQVDAEVAAVFRKANKLMEDKKNLKVTHSFRNYLDKKYKGELEEAGRQFGAELARISEVPGVADAMPQLRSEFERFTRVLAEYQKMQDVEDGFYR
ncbi:MAG TPA: hypothetical protein VG406_23990 [Isosphaeraceae bacterium]|jgi:DNA-directed RNA polymerase subunit RPC12/RpoP|nr:hypothetical protein [Isosphaeraceae bacterium]